MGRNILKLAFAGLFSLGLSACTTKPVDENQRDTSGQYDGAWEMAILPTSPDQRSGQWRFSCPNMEGRHLLLVKDGKVALAKDAKGYINKEGFFKLVVQTTSQTKEGPASDAVLLPDDIILYISGNLSEGKRKGKHVLGGKRKGEVGCVSRLIFTRQDTPKSSALSQ